MAHSETGVMRLSRCVLSESDSGTNIKARCRTFKSPAMDSIDFPISLDDLDRFDRWVHSSFLSARDLAAIARRISSCAFFQSPKEIPLLLKIHELSMKLSQPPWRFIRWTRRTVRVFLVVPLACRITFPESRFRSRLGNVTRVSHTESKWKRVRTLSGSQGKYSFVS